jgi:ABC-type nitrate/sulfonate/bicarbonate transport system permease component
VAWTRVAAAVAVIVVWQALPKSVLPDYVFGKPWDVLVALGKLIVSGQLITATGSTLQTTLLGVVIGAPIGIGFALLAALPVLRWVVEPWGNLIYGIPKIGLVSLLILWVGLSSSAQLMLVLLSVIFVYYFAAKQGLHEIDQRRVTAFKLMGAGRVKIARSLYLGSIAPHLIGATRLALPLGFGTAIFGELRVPTDDNLGRLLNQYAQALDGASAIAVVLAVGLVAFAIDLVARAGLSYYSRLVGTGVTAGD